MRKALKEKSVIAGTLNCLNGNQITATYTVEKFLGAGGSGLVYLCSDDSNKKYALKELYPKELEFMLKRIDDRLEYVAFATADVKVSFEWYKQNLIRENQLCKQTSSIRNLDNNDPFFLDCKGILVINETTIYSVYETFYGFSLEEYIAANKEKGNINNIEYLSRILGIIAIIAKKTTLLHRQNILHLDISPSNILLVDYGAGLINSKDSDTPCLLDFGSAYKKDEETSIDHRFSASEGYSAPEIIAKCQGLGEEYDIDESADTYSLVAILYSALMGETYDDPLGLYIDKQNNILSTYPEEVYRSLTEIFNKGLHAESWERFDSADELADRLLQVRGELLQNGNEDLAILFESISKQDTKIDRIEKTQFDIKEGINKVIEDVNHSNAETLLGIDKGSSDIKQHINKWAFTLSGLVATVLFVIIAVWRPWMNNENYTADSSNSNNGSMISDLTVPTLNISRANDSMVVYVDGTLSFVVYVDENVDLKSYKLTPEMIQLKEGAQASISVTGSGLERIVTLSNLQGNTGFYDITIQEGAVVDKAGQKSLKTTSDQFYLKTYDEDKTAPTMYISRPVNGMGSSYINNGDTLTFEVEFSDNFELDEIFLSPDMIDLGEGLDADITVTGQGTKRKVSLSNINGVQGEHVVTVKTGAANDKAGNISFSLTTDAFCIRNNDQTIPTLAITKPEIKGGVVSFVVYADDELQLNKFDIQPLDIATTGFVADISITGNGSVRMITCSNIIPSDNYGSITIAAGVAIDNNGNWSKKIQSSSFSIDSSKPVSAISEASNPAIEEGGTVSYLISVNDNTGVVHFGIHEDDIDTVGFSADIIITDETAFVKKITFSNIISNDDTIYKKHFKLSSGVAKDGWGNETNEKTSPAFEINS